jgi:glutaminyl-peptide cyclotransferase
MKKLFFAIPILFFISCKEDDAGNGKPETPPITQTNGIAEPAILKANLIAEYKHDVTSFTEGLQYYNGKMYESRGDYANSALTVSDLKTGNILLKHKIGATPTDSTFGEGLTIINNKLYQLTWQNHVVFVYDINDLSKPIKKFNWASEGWGMTNDGKNIIIGDGVTSNLYFVNPDDFKITRVQAVVDNNGPIAVQTINELEYIDGFVFANMWNTDYIIKIDPTSGHVVGRLHTNELLKSFYATYEASPEKGNVLNGIAYDSATKKIFITGKNWPKIFEISLN